MRTIGGLAVALLVVAAARGDDVKNAFLQGTLKLPGVPVEVIVTNVEGLRTADPRPDPRKRIDELRAALKDDDSDAARYSDLGELYHDIGDDDASRKAFARAAELYRQQADAAPERADLLLPLGDALVSAQRWEDAERVLREAVRRMPRDYEAWVEWGSFLDQRAMDELLGGPDHWTKQFGLGELYQMALDEKFAREDAERADELLAEAARCFDRAVETASDQPGAYTARAGALWWHSKFRVIVDVASRKQVCAFDPSGVPSEYLADMRRAIALGLKDVRKIVEAVCFETKAALVESQTAPSLEGTRLWEALPGKTRERIGRDLDLLRKLGEDADPAKASEALRTLAMLQFLVVGDRKAGEKNVRRALELDSKNAGAWELLLWVVVSDDRAEDCLEVCKERVRQCDGPRSRLLLAKSYVRQGEYDAAEEHYRAAVRMAPDDFLANLSLATIFLKRAGDEASFQLAFLQLERTKVIAEKAAEWSREEVLHLAVLHAVAKAISGDEDEARDALKQILETDPDNEMARDALAVLKK